MSNTKPCVMCDKPLEPVLQPTDNKDPWLHMQPYGGGEMKLVFSYGSTRFDNCSGTTTFRGLICDACAERLVSKMTENRQWMGRVVHPTDGSVTAQIG